MIETPIIMDAKYDPRYCLQVIELGSQGKSRAQIAKALGVSSKTVDRWRKDPKYPEFNYAMEIALTNAQAFMEEVGLKGIKGEYMKFNPAAWQFSMKNLFKDDYKDSTETTLDVQHTVKELSDDEMNEQIKLLMARNIAIPHSSNNSGTPILIEG